MDQPDRDDHKFQVKVADGHKPHADQMFELCERLVEVYGAQRVQIGVDFEDGGRVTFEHSIPLKLEIERQRDYQ